MNRKKSILSTAVGLLLMVCIAAAAWRMPGVIYSFSDKAAFAKREEIHMELRQFEKEGSFFGQLRSLALCSCGLSKMQSVRVENEATMDKEELTKVIQGELSKMNEAGVLENRYEIRLQDLVGCELYMAYLDGWSGGETRESVAFWKAHYQRPKEEEGWYDIELIIDMEYHKIYDITVKDSAVNEAVQAYDAKINKGYKSIMKYYEEEQWTFLDQMFNHYYELDENEYMCVAGDVYDDTMYDISTTSQSEQGTFEQNMNESKKEARQIIYQLKGSLYFERDKNADGYYLPFVKEYGYEEDGEALMHIGIAELEQILQL